MTTLSRSGGASGLSAGAMGAFDAVAESRASAVGNSTLPKMERGMRELRKHSPTEAITITAPRKSRPVHI
ncbi:uncharacterized protein N7459_010055 [Penicillium hispanicum]|uniref:uncharacterized protein n=1 Tax=Penicillium hispanicum TaxID=1080232 RepID=UPI002540C85D|nr:uncharacterized protein N7459_010055 [Penicillium hispanicum]KAJ5570625.1 hypothetical protein N7459_010055 [Penicillium hispanicum]